MFNDQPELKNFSDELIKWFKDNNIDPKSLTLDMIRSELAATGISVVLRCDFSDNTSIFSVYNIHHKMTIQQLLNDINQSVIDDFKSKVLSKHTEIKDNQAQTIKETTYFVKYSEFNAEYIRESNIKENDIDNIFSSDNHSESTENAITRLKQKFK